MEAGTPLGMIVSGRRHVRAACSAAEGETAMPRSKRAKTPCASARRATPHTGLSSSAYMWNVQTCAAGDDDQSA